MKNVSTTLKDEYYEMLVKMAKDNKRSIRQEASIAIEKYISDYGK